MTDTITASSPLTTAQSNAIARSKVLNGDITTIMNEITTVLFARGDDRVTSQLEAGFAVRSYYEAPRLLVASTRQDSSGLDVALDLVRTNAQTSRIRARRSVRPIHGAAGAIREPVWRVRSSRESPARRYSFTSVLENVAAANGQLVPLSADNLEDLDSLPLSADAKARITHSVEAGKVVLTPSLMVMINGESTIEWIEFDPSTGQVTSVTPDGGHEGDYLIPINNAFNLVSAGAIGFYEGFAVSQLKFIGYFLGGSEGDGSLGSAVHDASRRWRQTSPSHSPS